MRESHCCDEMAGTVACAVKGADPALRVTSIDRERSFELLMSFRTENAVFDGAEEHPLEGGIRRTLEDVKHRVFEILGNLGMPRRSAIERELTELDPNRFRYLATLEHVGRGKCGKYGSFSSLAAKRVEVGKGGNDG